MYVDNKGYSSENEIKKFRLIIRYDKYFLLYTEK